MDSRRGQSVMLAYMAVAVMTIIGGSLLTRGFSAHQHSQVEHLQADLLYAAEGGLEDALGRFAQAIANFQVDPNMPRYPVVAGEFLTVVFPSGATASSEVLEGEPAPRTVADPDGISLFVKNYHVITTVTHPSTSQTMTLHQMVARRIIYTFQHAVFYNDNDLEWLPGPDMTLSGRVHSNSDIYLGSHNLLTVDSEYLRAAGKFYNRRKDSAMAMNGTVQVKLLGSSPATFPAVAGLDSDDANWVAESQTRWNGTVKTGEHGVTKRAVPVVGSITPGGFYDSNADVKIVNGTVTKGGLPLIEGMDLPPGTITTTTTFFNNREGAYVRMTNVDMKRLAGYFDADADGTMDPPGVNGNPYTNKLPSNGLLYATRTDAAASEQPGIRLLNGSEIVRSGGLTVVSNDPVYVQGNYNTTSKKPSAIIADALNLLSSNWQDANSIVNNVNAGSPRTAAATTFNAAFIAGVDTTTPGQYNGGLENYPRLHERWTNVQLTITGSFVSLWNSLIATGARDYGQQSSQSQYTAPNRVWNYDTSFSSGTNMPPFTPWAVEMLKGAWWKE